MSSTTAFFSSEEEVIHRHVSNTSEKTRQEDIDRVYEIDRCCRWIKDGAHKQVALQFPDELLCDSVAVASRLQGSLGDERIFILGDTSYGSCCVDEVAAQHYNADCLIHYGHSCLSSTSRLPVLYVFGELPVDVEDCVQQVATLFPDKDSSIIIMFDTVYSNSVDQISRQLQEKYKQLIASELVVPVRQRICHASDLNCDSCSQQQNESKKVQSETDSYQSEADNVVCKCGRKLTLPKSKLLSEFSVLYIGEEGLSLTNLMYTFKDCPFYSYNPRCKVGRKESVSVNRVLMKRYYMIEKAKDARIVGILVGTLGVRNYLQILNRLQDIIKMAGKKSYTFVVGKINVPKLANFMEVDVYVLVACQENTLLDSSEFYKPVVSPYEMELACNTDREWTGEIVTDFGQLLPGGGHHVEMKDQQDQGQTTDVSLITGKLRQLGKGDNPPEVGTELVTRSDAMAVTAVNAETAGEYLASRSWRGLEKSLGKTAVSKAVEGTKGIAMEYSHEPTASYNKS